MADTVTGDVTYRATWTKETEQPEPAGGSPETGDANNLTIWFVLMILAAAGAVFLTAGSRAGRKLQK